MKLPDSTAVGVLAKVVRIAGSTQSRAIRL